jgi:hypothetical protein
VKETVTSVLFQPFELAAGEAEPEIEGAVLSTIKCCVLLAVLPALSSQVPTTGTEAPSLLV